MSHFLPASANVDPMHDSTHDVAQTARALWRANHANHASDLSSANGVSGASGVTGAISSHLPSGDRRGRIDSAIRTIDVIDAFDAIDAIDILDRASFLVPHAAPASPEPSTKSASPFVQLPSAGPESSPPALLSSNRRPLPARHDMTASGAESHESRESHDPLDPLESRESRESHVPAPATRLAPIGGATLNEAERLAALRRYEILDTPPEPAFERVVRLASYVLGAPISLISLIDETRQWFKARQGIEVSQTPRSMAFCAHAILSDDVLVVPDARADRRFADNPLVTGEPNIRFYAGAPLRTPEGHRLGTLCVIDRHPRALDDEKRALLADLSAIVVNELELRRVNQVLGDMAMRDGLTGALNRRAFLMQADRLFAAARAQQRRLAVLMLDIDHFKMVNDTWGHAIGDRVIVELTLVLRATLRKGTVIGRLGGEEFAVLLPEADAKRALQASERLLSAIGGASVPGPNGPIRFSASIGVGSLALDDPDFGTLLQRADRALYTAKQSGRNRVAVL